MRRSPERVLLAAGTQTYDSGEFETLDRVPTSLRLVVEVLAGMGYSTTGDDADGYLLDPDTERLRDAIDRVRDADAPVVVVYYTGHGERPERDRFYLLTRNSRMQNLRRSALLATEFVDLLTRRDEHGQLRAEQPAVLVILDCCFSGGAAMEALSSALAGIGNPRTWMIASASDIGWAQQGRFAAALAESLHEPQTGPSQRYLSLDVVVQAVNELGSGEQEARWFPPPTGSTGLPPFFPNPLYKPSLAGLTLDEQHWRSRLEAGATDRGSFYLTGTTGRVRAVEDLADWLTATGRGGLAVLTGSPGSGKSALLALPVFVVDRARRSTLLRDAEPGSLLLRAAEQLPTGQAIVAVHARGLNTDQIAAAVGQGIDMPATSAAALVDAVADPGPPADVVVIVDAVDEATDPTGLLTELLLPLARAGLPVLIGTRRHLLDPIRDSADLVIDLDTERYRDPEALTRYVHQLLVAAKETDAVTPYRTGSAVDDGATAAVAAAIAQRATAREGGAESFLIARLLALSVRSRPTVVDITDSRWRTELPASLEAAFDEDLTHRLGDQVAVGRALLVALAWARGPGLPWETLWVPVARAIAAGPAGADVSNRITDEDVRWLMRTAGSYIVEDLGPAGRSVFRPFHDLLAAHLRGETGGDEEPEVPAPQRRRHRTEAAITRALLDTLPAERQLRWPSAHPYLRTYLAEHAAAGEPTTLSDLVADPDFLAVADPITLIPLLSPTDPGLRDVARSYRRAFPLLTDDPRTNLAHLREAAVALHGTEPPPEPTGIRPRYRTRLASVRPDDSLLVLTGHTDGVTCVAFGTSAQGRLVLASGGHRKDATVRLWDPRTGAPIGQPLPHVGGVASLAFGTGAGGRPLLASATYDGAVQLWDPATGASVGRRLESPGRSVAFGVGRDGQPLLAVAGSGRVLVWDLTSGKPLDPPIPEQAIAVAFGIGPAGPLLATASGRDGAALWDPETGVRVGRRTAPVPLAAVRFWDAVWEYPGSWWVESVALGTGMNGRPVLATCAGQYNPTVRLWDLRTGAPICRLRTDTAKRMESLAFGTAPDGRPLLAGVSGLDRSRTVRLWDLTTDSPDSWELTGHTDTVSSVAFGRGAGGQPLLATASWDQTVRVWDPSADPNAGPGSGHTDRVAAVAVGSEADGRPMVASASQDGTVRLWHHQQGGVTPGRDPLPSSQRLLIHTAEGPGSMGVTAVAFGTGADGRLLLASTGWDGSTLLWDPTTGSPIGWPLLPGGTLARLQNRFWSYQSPDMFNNSVAFGTGAGGQPLLATGGQTHGGGVIRLWDPTTGRPIGKPLIADDRQVHAVTFGTGAGGRPLLASAGWDGAIRLWDPDTRSPIRQLLTGRAVSIQALAFGIGADGRPLLASGGWDHTVRLWDPDTGSPIGPPLTGHSQRVTSVAFGTGADGRPLLASTGPDRTVRLWDLTTGNQVTVLRRRSQGNAVAFVDGAVAIGDDEGLSIIELDVLGSAELTATWPG